MQICTNRFLGYDKDEDGNLVVNSEEAEVVKRIYREFLEGKSYYKIGKGLTADGIKTAAGSDFWLASTLRKILMKPDIFDLRQRHNRPDARKPLESANLLAPGAFSFFLAVPLRQNDQRHSG